MIKVLWVDDEIDYLKPHVIFLKGKDCDVTTLGNGYDAVDLVRKEKFDIIILDEMMPGMTGLDTLDKIKEIAPTVPVIMATKSEQESIMDRAVGNKITDYLIKPINPIQIWSSIRRAVFRESIVSSQTMTNYRLQFGQIMTMINSARSFEDWKTIYRKLVGWEVELSGSSNKEATEILNSQMIDANSEFAKFIKREYKSWFSDRQEEDVPMLSHMVMRNKVFPIADMPGKTTLLVIDNFRYDQWLMILPFLSPMFDVVSSDFYCSILPTSTQYARNALFAGLTPLAIEKLMPELWTGDMETFGKNRHEEDFLKRLVRQSGKDYKMTFDKLITADAGKRLLDGFDRVMSANFSVIVYNFLDILSHARTETEVIRELSENDAAFRTLTKSWFEHSDLREMLIRLSKNGNRVIVTSDHGAQRVTNPVRIVGDRESSTNLRYKTGKNLNYTSKELFVIDNPHEVHLPKSNLSSTYVFATGRDYLVYRTNYNDFARYYKDTFQHGGISLQEMMVPFILLDPKREL